MVDQIIIESYQNFLSKKSECEINQILPKWRSKRGIGDQSFGASSHYGSDCCPPVVDSLTYIALLGFIGAATYFLQFTITMILVSMVFFILISQFVMHIKMSSYINKKNEGDLLPCEG